MSFRWEIRGAVWCGAEWNQERGEARKSQIGTGDRSEKIRTYNFSQDRVTDHRINVTLYNLNDVLDGNLKPLIEPLTTYYQHNSWGRRDRLDH